jgi:flagellar secretion chaperone FliS
MSFAVAQYRNVKVETASPVRLLVQFYDGAIRSLEKASLTITSRDPNTNAHLGKAHQIVSELQATLEPSQAPELCAELNKLYDFILYRINQASVSPKTETIEPAIKILKELRGAWDELARK